MNKIVCIGDSFCTSFKYYKKRPWERESFWIEDLENKFKNHIFVVDGHPSRDVQTIVDHWIKCLPKLSKDDYLIICLPHFNRTRLPYHEENYYTVKENKTNKLFLTGRFVGTKSYEVHRHKLEFWEHDYHREYFIEKLSHQEIINASVANQKNMIEIIESLLEISKCNVYVFCWDNMDIKSNYIDDKSILIEKVGEWETNGDVYKKTNGEFGFNGDCHWSHKYNSDFAEFIEKKIMNNDFYKLEKKII